MIYIVHAVSVGKFLRRKCTHVPPGSQGFLSDGGTLSFAQTRWFAICEPLACSASVTTEVLGGH